MIWHKAWSRLSAGISPVLPTGLPNRVAAAQAAPRREIPRGQSEVHLGQFVAPLGPSNAMAWNGRRSERLWQAMLVERERMGIDALAVVDQEIRRVRR